MLPLSHSVRAHEFQFVNVTRLNQFASCPLPEAGPAKTDTGWRGRVPDGSS
jgi:hypothetical protein